MGTAAVIASIAQLLSVALEAVQAATAATTTLKQAQAEAWPDGDPRWTQPFADLDAALAKAQGRLT
jgi:hypothetical protein